MQGLPGSSRNSAGDGGGGGVRVFVFMLCVHHGVGCIFDMLADFHTSEHVVSAILDPIPQSARNQFAQRFPVVTQKRTKHADGHLR